MAEIRSFSHGVDRLLEAIQPYGGYEKVAFPHALDEDAARRSPGESLHEWFVRLVDDVCDGDAKTSAIEDNIAVFLRNLWSKDGNLIYANIQVIVSHVDLDEYYLDGACDAIYLRLDFDYRTLGDPFSHPLAHIHLDGDLSPRFALDGGNSGNIVVDFMEFIYRHYVPGKWRKWAEREWYKHFPRATDDDKDPFQIMMKAFASSQFGILQDNADNLEMLKALLRKKKDEIFKLHMEGSHRLVLEYPTAR